MQPRHVTEEELIDLAGGHLSVREEARVRAHIQRCEACEFQSRAVLRAREILQSSDRPYFKNERLLETAASRPTRNPVRRSAILGVAAAALVGMLIVVPQFRSAPEAYWMNVDQTAAQLRDLPEPAVQAYQKALQAYSEHDADLTLQHLAQIDLPPDRTDGTAIVARLLRASAQLNKGNNEAALQTLEPLQIELLPAPWRGRIGWVRYLAYDRLQRTDEACELLEWLRIEPDGVGERVREAFASGACTNSAH